MKISITILMFFLLKLNLQAQVIVSGQVKDAETKSFVEFCTVQIIDKKDSLINGVATNEKGFFSAEINKGTYKFVLSLIGYKNDTTKVKRISRTEFLGVFKLEKDNYELAEIEINAQTTENKLDREVVTITKKVKIGASDTKDILNKLNGISYDYFSNILTVDGQKNIVLLVNGLQKDTEYIKNLSPDRIKKVEIIRDPGEKYGIKGYDAVINIILTVNYEGVEFAVNNTAMFDPDVKNKVNILPVNILYSSINYTKNKINVYATISNFHKKINIITTLKKEYSTGLIQNNLMQENDDNYTYKYTTNDYILGADYYINPKHTISFESKISSFPVSKDFRVENYKVTKIINATKLDTYETESSNKSSSRYFRNTLFYKYIINKKNVINADFSYSYYVDDYENIYKEISRYESCENSIKTQNNTMFYVNFKHEFSKKTSIRTGYGNVNTSMNSIDTANIKELLNNNTEQKTNSVKYNDFRHHIYSYFSWEPNKKIGFKAGGVIETNTPKSEIIQDKRFVTYQPYLSILFKPSKKINFSLKYITRAVYPSISRLNPFVEIIDNQTIKKGNINLHPRTLHKISLRSNLFKNKISIQPYYKFSDDYISKTATLRSDGILEYSYANIGKYYSAGANVNFTIPFGKSLSLQSSFNFFKNSMQDINIDNEFFDWTTTQQLMYVNQKNDMSVGLIYNKLLHKYITAYGYVKADDDYWMFMVQKGFFKSKLNVTLGYFLPLDFGVSYEQSQYTKTKDYYSEEISNINILKNFVLLELRYNFNKGKKIKKIRKKVKDEKEIKVNE